MARPHQHGWRLYGLCLRLGVVTLRWCVAAGLVLKSDTQVLPLDYRPWPTRPPCFSFDSSSECMPYAACAGFEKMK